MFFLKWICFKTICVKLYIGINRAGDHSEICVMRRQISATDKQKMLLGNCLVCLLKHIRINAIPK